MNEDTQENRTSDTTTLLNYGKTTYRMDKILEKGVSLGSIDVELGEQESVELVLMEDAKELININDEKREYKYEVIGSNAKAPVRVGDKVGEVHIYSGEEEIMVKDLTVKESVEKCSLFTMLKRVFKVLVLGTR